MQLFIIFPLLQTTMGVLSLKYMSFSTNIYTYPNTYSLRNFYPDRTVGKSVIGWIFTSNGFNGSHIKVIFPNTRLFFAMETEEQTVLLPRENNWSYLMGLPLGLTWAIITAMLAISAGSMRMSFALQVTEVNGEDLMAECWSRLNAGSQMPIHSR